MSRLMPLAVLAAIALVALTTGRAPCSGLIVINCQAPAPGASASPLLFLLVRLSRAQGIVGACAVTALSALCQPPLGPDSRQPAEPADDTATRGDTPAATPLPVLDDTAAPGGAA